MKFLSFTRTLEDFVSDPVDGDDSQARADIVGPGPFRVDYVDGDMSLLTLVPNLWRHAGISRAITFSTAYMFLAGMIATGITWEESHHTATNVEDLTVWNYNTHEPIETSIASKAWSGVYQVYSDFSSFAHFMMTFFVFNAISRFHRVSGLLHNGTMGVV